MSTTSELLPKALKQLDEIEIDRIFFKLGETIIFELEDEYLEKLEEEDWSATINACREYIEEDEDGQKVGRVLLGTAFSLNPSGKFWTFWANSNVDGVEMILDSAFNEALERVAANHGGWIESGEGDPCDVFFGIVLD